MKIQIDYRETKIIKKFLAKNKIEYEIKQLPTADFIINGIGIERKTQMDFLNSIIDKRIINQLIVLKENFKMPLLIIEGEENLYEIRNFSPNSIRGMLTSIIIDYKVPILYTRSPKDTASLLISILKKLEKTKKPVGMLTKRKPLTLKEQQEFIIESLPKIGPTISKNLLKKFKTVKNIMNANEKELQEIEKIGPKKAREIKKVIEESYNQNNQ